MQKEKLKKQQAWGLKVFGLSAYANIWIWLMLVVLAVFFIYDVTGYSPGVNFTLILGAAVIMYGLCCGITIRWLNRGSLISNLIFLPLFIVFTCLDAAVSLSSALAGPAAGTGSIGPGGGEIIGGGDMGGGIGIMPMDGYAMDMGGMMEVGGTAAVDTGAVILRYLPLLLAAAACVVVAVIMFVSLIRNRVFFLNSAKQLEQKRLADAEAADNDAVAGVAY